MEAPVNRNPQASVLSVNSNSDTDTANKTAVLEKFTSFMGTKSQETNSVTSGRLKDMARLLSSSTGEDEVVLVVPSLDLRLTEGGEYGKNDLLPQMGEHAVPSDSDGANAYSDSAADGSTDSTTRPSMDASVLALASDKMDIVEPMAATNIGKQTSWTRSTLSYASSAVNMNVTDSFTTLLNSRLRAWTLILLRHSLSTGSVESRSKLLSMLGAVIHVDSSESKYRTLPLPDAAKGAKPKDSDIILPLLFEISLHISIQSKPEKVILRAPGTISAIFDHESDDALKKVTIQLDTSVFFKSMVDQARIVVLKAVALATETPIPSNSKPESRSGSLIASEPSQKSSNLDALSYSRESSKRPTTTELTRLQKARKSALRLNNVLHGKPLKGTSSSINLGVSSGIADVGARKTSSIRWDTRIQSPKFTSALALTPNLDKQPAGRKANKLESYKSFGRPHGGDFGSGPRNATFGEYGRPAFSGSWGRDGRLAAHPMPGKNSAVDAMGNLVGGSADMNATFDNVLSQTKNALASPHVLTQFDGATSSYRSSAASAGAALLGRISNSVSIDGPSLERDVSMVRTATALESSLMKKWS